MKTEIHPDPKRANEAAADHLAGLLVRPATRAVMVAAGNTPIELYRAIAQRKLRLAHLHVFALDEYVGVPLDEPRNCGNLLRGAVAEAWGIPRDRFHAVSSRPEDASASVREHERLIAELGGLDVTVLGLGQNGHLGFNEPGSPPDGEGRLLDLEPVSTEANRVWFGGRYAPSQGVTVGLRTILASRTIVLLAFGAHKAAAVARMVRGPREAACPASWLQGHANARVFLDTAAAAALDRG